MWGEGYGYQQDREQARQLLDSWIAMGERN